ncbi:MAG TPA: acyl carrier protein [Clostridiales bacterium]|jgi:acyl carrier protein|nr:acyl carrier protein [Clostridiales bacterium]
MVFEKIAQLVADACDMDVKEVTKETSFEDMELDSLDVIEVVMAIEEEFKINLETGDDLKTVGDLVKLVETKTGA